MYQIDHDTFVCHDTVRALQISADFETALYARFLRQAQISILEIFHIFLWLIRLRWIAFLELKHKLLFFKGLTVTRDGIKAGMVKFRFGDSSLSIQDKTRQIQDYARLFRKQLLHKFHLPVDS